MMTAIVVIVYDRPNTLRRLLDSLAVADYEGQTDIPLVITIDQGESGGRKAVAKLAHEFEWPFGPKRVIDQPDHLGLVEHFWTAGRLSADYDAILLLEDDLTVAPPFFRFASQAFSRYEGDERIAGVCLYDLWFNGYTRLPFQPLNDGFDAYFIQAPYLQGLAFTAAQWQRFDAWWQKNGPRVNPHPALHPSFLEFGEDEWLPALASYMAYEGRYLCFPRAGLIASWGDPGVHFDRRTDWFLAPVQLRGGDYRLPALDESLAVYDAFFELTPQRVRTLAPSLSDTDFDVDLNGTKQTYNLQYERVLTTRPARRTEASFGLRVQPLELNVIQALPGSEIGLARLEDVHWGRWSGLEARRRLEALAWSKRSSSRRRGLAFLLARGIQLVRRVADAMRPQRRE